MNRFDQLEPAALATLLADEMARGLPGRLAQRTMAPRLAYGRHHGPVPDDARRSAVLLALCPSSAGWSIPALLRPPTMRSHAGQISLPGGTIEPDETPVQAALREFEEELGVPASGLNVLGRLTPVYVFISGFEITPLVAVASHRLEFDPNPHEVASIAELPLAQLCDPACHNVQVIERHGLRFQAPHFSIAGQQVWGATSLILAELAAILGRRINEHI